MNVIWSKYVQGTKTLYYSRKPRIRAFAEFARRYGVEELEKCLLRNKENLSLTEPYIWHIFAHKDRYPPKKGSISL